MTKQSNRITKKSLNLVYSLSIFRGISAGILMMILLQAVNISNMEYGQYFKFFAFIILGLAIADGIQSFKKKFRPREKTGIFKHNLILGLIISVMSGISIALMNTLWYIANTELVISLIQRSVQDFSQLMVVNGGLFFLCLAVGMIMTLMSLQLHKEGVHP